MEVALARRGTAMCLHSVRPTRVFVAGVGSCGILSCFLLIGVVVLMCEMNTVWGPCAGILYLFFYLCFMS